ncbi:YceI family protein [Opitutaceae bacterium]|nr:YceI family protein [Opitutaceae bacterium]
MLRRTVLVVFLVLGFVGSLAAGDYQLSDHTIRWTGSTPVKNHTGLLSPKSSAIRIDGEGKVELLEVVLDMDSIDVTDMGEGRGRNRLTGHLKNADFFDVPTHPTARFTMNRHEGGQLKGEIEIRGVLKDFAIPVKVTGDAVKGWALTGEFTFNRYEFGVSHQEGKLLSIAKDKLVDEEIKIEVALQVTPAP